MILDANNAALTMFGYSYEDILKLQFLDLSAEPEKTKQAIDAGVTHVFVRWYKRKINQYSSRS